MDILDTWREATEEGPTEPPAVVWHVDMLAEAVEGVPLEGGRGSIGFIVAYKARNGLRQYPKAQVFQFHTIAGFGLAAWEHAHGDLFHHGQTSKMSNLSHKLITPTKSNYWKALSFCSATFHEYTFKKIGEFHLGGGTFMICIRSSFWCIGYFCQYEFIIGYIYHTIYHTWQFIISRVFFTHDNHWFPFQCFGCQIFPTWGAIAPSHPSS